MCKKMMKRYGELVEVIFCFFSKENMDGEEIWGTLSKSTKKVLPKQSFSTFP